MVKSMFIYVQRGKANLGQDEHLVYLVFILLFLQFFFKLGSFQNEKLGEVVQHVGLNEKGPGRQGWGPAENLTCVRCSRGLPKGSVTREGG